MKRKVEKVVKGSFSGWFESRWFTFPENVGNLLQKFFGNLSIVVIGIAYDYESIGFGPLEEMF